jgi:hypothetical protein
MANKLIFKIEQFGITVTSHLIIRMICKMQQNHPNRVQGDLLSNAVDEVIVMLLKQRKQY